MEEKYKELKERQQEEIDALPIYWAFGKKQLDELMEKLDIKDEEELKEKCFGIFGGLALKEDKALIFDTFKQHNEELQKACEDDDFLQDALEYELSNHEYVVTYEIEPALQALGITYQDYKESGRLKKIAKKAVDNYLQAMEKIGWL